jgi:asparagine synthase (glutamine-hydrolysing)
MCGFIGRIRPDPLAPNRDLRAGLRFLGRRGPDSAKLWASDDGCIELLHARLAIVDSDPRARQPFEDSDRGLCLAFNGEIYNYLELRSALRDYPFRTTSDTEVLLALYAQEGLKGFERLRGMYSIALADARARRVFLVRDPIGKKPLFLARWGEEMLFGSSLLALVAAHSAPAKLNAEIAEHYWNEGFVPPTQSVLSNATPVQPGQIVELDWSGRRISERQHAPAPAFAFKGESVGEAAEKTGQLLSRAVELRLQNNPSPAVLLSGGIDSTVITQLACRIHDRGGFSRPLQILTLGSIVPLGNDEFYARYAARRLRRKVQVVKPALAHPGDAIIRCLDLQDEPLGMPSFFPLERVVAAVAPFSRVLISGDGGDEVFLGYGKPAKWLDRDSRLKENEGHLSCGPLLPPWMSAWGRSMVTTHLVGHGLAKVDRATAEQAVEMRCPLLDWDLVNYARTLPFEVLCHDNKSKALLKAQLAGWPQWFLERPKLGFTLNLRWLWGASNFTGLREAISAETVETFTQWLPEPLRASSGEWRALDIFRNFQGAWRMLAWSQFLARFGEAQRASPVATVPSTACA